MSSTTDALKADQKLAILKATMRHNITDEKVKFLFPQSGDINKRFSTNTDNHGQTALQIAFEIHSMSIFETLLRHGADFLVTDKNNSTIAHLALKLSRKLFIDIILSLQMKSKNITNFCNDEGISHFHAACMANNVKAVEFFLNNGVSVNHTVNEDASDFAGFSPLHFAATYCNYEVAEVLLKHGANMSIKNTRGSMPLHVVLENSLQAINKESNTSLSHWQKMKQLFLVYIVNSGTNIIDDSGLSCFHVACTFMDFTLIEQLLKRSLDINHPISKKSHLWPGYTALHFAVIFSNFNVIKFLVKQGADLRIKDLNDVTPLDLCLTRYKEEDIHAILSMNKIWKNIVLSDGKTKLLDVIIAMKDYNQFSKFLRRLSKNVNIVIPIDSPLWPGYTLLHLALLFHKPNKQFSFNHNIVNKNAQMIMELLSKDADLINTQDVHGRTPIHMCFRMSKKLELLDSLLEACQNFDNPHDLVDEDNLSLLHIACTRNNTSLVEKLLASSNSVNIAYKGKSIPGLIEYTWTPLHAAVFSNSLGVIKPLLAHDADIHATDEKGQTPVHLVFLCRKSFSEMIGRILLSTKHLKDVVVRDTGLSHLHVACFCSEVNAATRLLDANVDVNKVYTAESKYDYYNGNNPLQVALRSNSTIQMIDLLIKRGADVFAKNHSSIPIIYNNYLKTNFYQSYFAKLWNRDENLYERVKLEFGLTKLHIACATNDTDYIKTLLNSGAKINTRINLDSPIWPGDTPLHFLIRQPFDLTNNQDKIHLLLNKGAEVTLSNANQETPLLKAYKYYACDFWNIVWMGSEKYKEKCDLVKSLLDGQTDFSVNPASVEGITHFHVACSMGNTFVVEKYLERGVTDNRPINFLFEHSGKGVQLAGYTPLHLAVTSTKNSVDTTTQLEIVDLLLKNGADVNAQNSCGNTPLHISDRFAVFERIMRSGADTSITNAYGNNPLEYFLSEYKSSIAYGIEEKISTEDRIEKKISTNDIVQCWLRSGLYLNRYNIETKEGFIALIFRFVDQLQLFVSTAAINFPQSLETDKKGRTVIHNIVSTHDRRFTSANECASLIEQLSKAGYDIDAQDESGRTALHVAVEFTNYQGISGLLMAGADVNIKDNNGRTPMAYSFEKCTRDEFEDDDDECEHYSMFKALAVHVRKLQLCDLDVCEFNRIRVQRAFEIFYTTGVQEQFFNEIDELANVKIKGHSASMRNLLSEIDLVADYPIMSEMKRNAIDKFFRSSEIHYFREKFSEVAGIIQLQYRKAVMRCQLVEEAKGSLTFIAGFRWPDICFHIVIKSLTNTDLKNLITSTIL